jgi:hypothetical protein
MRGRERERERTSERVSGNLEANECASIAFYCFLIL